LSRGLHEGFKISQDWMFTHIPEQAESTNPFTLTFPGRNSAS
jgi:hypothetical protein